MPHRFCLALDLVNDPQSMSVYRDWHRVGRTPPAIIASIRDAGILEMEIFQVEDRLFMLMDVADDFSPEAKAAADAADEDVQAWERLMSQFQRPLASASAGEKWLPATCIFRLSDHGAP